MCEKTVSYPGLLFVRGWELVHTNPLGYLGSIGFELLLAKDYISLYELAFSSLLMCLNLECYYIFYLPELFEQ